MVKRNLTDSLLQALADSPVVLLNGARQTGKTTLVQSLTPKQHPARYLTLDDLGVLSAIKADPAGFLAGLEGPVILDEIQRAPELFVAIKAEVDRNRRPGRFLLTGSANVLLLPRLSESLAGRMEILTLWPLSRGEIEGVREEFVDAAFSAKPIAVDKPKGKPGLLGSILRGGYPENLHRTEGDRLKAWFRSYVTSILQRDVRDLANIEGLTEMPRLLSLLAARSTSLQNFSELSRSSGLPQSTLKRYMALLEATFLVQVVQPWSGNLSHRLVKTPKLMLADTGLLAHLLDLTEERLAADAGLKGSLLENFVAMELRKQIAWSKTQPRMYFYRTQTGQEIDIILEDASGRLVGIEVKASATVKAEDFRWLKAFAGETKKKFHRGVVLYLGHESIPFGANLHALPVGALWAATAKHG